MVAVADPPVAAAGARLLTDPVLAGVRAVLGGATTALTFTCALDTLPARTLPAAV